MPGISGHWGERSVLSAFFLTTVMLTGLAAAEDCFVDPPASAKAMKPNKRPTAPKVKKQPPPLAAPVTAASGPAVARPKPKPRLRPAPVAHPTQARIPVDCPKEPAAPTAVLNESMSRPPRGDASLLAAARQAPVLTPTPTPTPASTPEDPAPKSSGPGLPRGDDLAFWPVAPVWQLTRDNTALLSSGASQAPGPSDRPDLPLAPVPPTTIPEPGTVSLLLVALVFIALKQVRR